MSDRRALRRDSGRVDFSADRGASRSVDVAPRASVASSALGLGSTGARLAGLERAVVQLRSAVARTGDGDDTRQAAARGVSGGGGVLPHAEQIQRSFGHHDTSSIRAHVGGAASDAAHAIGARAYATGDSVAFASTPDLHLAAHEAVHVVQQRHGVQLEGGVGTSGDTYERHADSVADRVVSGQSAQSLLDVHTPGGRTGGAVQGLFVQREGEHSLVTDGGTFTDWTLAVNQIQGLYTGHSIGSGYNRAKGAERWWNRSTPTDPTPLWQDLLVTAVGIAVAAATAGVGSVMTAALLPSGAAVAKLTRGIVNASVDAGKRTAIAVSGGMVKRAVATNSTNGKLAYYEATRDTIDAAIEDEWNTLNAGLQELADEDEDGRWAGLRSLFHGAYIGAHSAMDIQYGDTVEGWMSVSAQADTGREVSIEGFSLLSMYRDGRLSLREMQRIQAELQIGRTPAKLTADLQASLQRVFPGRRIEELRLTNVTRNEPLARSHATSSVGTIGLHIGWASGPTAMRSDPTVDYCEIESSTGINDDIRTYFLNSPKKIREFRTPKIIVHSDFSIGVNEENQMAPDSSPMGDITLMRYAALRGDTAADGAGRSALLARARLLLSQALLEKTLRQLGVTQISS